MGSENKITFKFYLHYVHEEKNHLNPPFTWE